MSLHDLNKDELILIIQQLEQKIKAETQAKMESMEAELRDLRWKYGYCYCEHDIKKCAFENCSARMISGKNMNWTFKDCETMYRCEKCSTPRRGQDQKYYGKWKTMVYYCDKHIEKHENIKNFKTHTNPYYALDVLEVHHY